jgi:hypothetical protein
MPYVNVRQLYSKAGAAREAGFCGPYAEDDPRRRPSFNPPVPPPPPVRGWGVIAYNIDASWLNWSAGCLSEDEASDQAFGWADGRWHFELPEDGRARMRSASRVAPKTSPSSMTLVARPRPCLMASWPG